MQRHLEVSTYRHQGGYHDSLVLGGLNEHLIIFVLLFNKDK